MSSKLGALQRPLRLCRATAPWRQAPGSGNSSSSSSINRGQYLSPARVQCRYNTSNASYVSGNNTRFRLRKHVVAKSFKGGPDQPPEKLESDRYVPPGQTNAGEPSFGAGSVHFGPYSIKLQLHGQLKDLDYTHLRDLCTCPTCVDQSTKQRNFQTSQIPLSIQPRSYGVKDGKLILKWRNDLPGFDSEHTSTYTEEQIADASRARRQETPDKHRIFWDRELFENNVRRFDWDDYMNNEEEFTRCMRDLSRFGLVILRGVPDSREMVKQIATKMGPIRNSFYGETWDVRSVQKPKNVAYTDQFLNFHMDLLYMRDPPGYQLLHCLRNSCTGGESLFSDGFRAAKYMHEQMQQEFNVLSRFEVNYGYKNMDQDYQFTRPTFEMLTGNKRLNKQMCIDHINYSPPFQAPFHKASFNHKWNHDYRGYIDAIRTFGNLLEDPKNMYEFKLDPGDCVIFENRRVVHARRSFDTSSGERWLAGAYVDEDAVRSKFRVLIEKHLDTWMESPHAPPDPNDKLQELGEWLKRKKSMDS